MLLERCGVLTASYQTALGKTNYSRLGIPFTLLNPALLRLHSGSVSWVSVPSRNPPKPFKATTVSYFPQSPLSCCVSPVNVCIMKRSCAPYGKMRKAMDSKFICRGCQPFVGLFLTKGNHANALSVSSTKLFPKSTQWGPRSTLWSVSIAQHTWKKSK